MEKRTNGNINSPISRLRNNHGATVILVAVLMFAFMGVTALALDVGHLYIVRNELQNAADAGALWGAHNLYNEDGTVIQEEANQAAYDAATQNRALSEEGAVAVDLNLETDIQRGHWCFATREFTANDSLVPVDLWGVSMEDLDVNPNFINAVQVVARRQTTPAASFFARIFGFQNFELSAEAVGYIGFSGRLAPGEADQPIAICMESILRNGDEYTCTIGRMINSGQDIADSETGGWTSFDQENPCQGGTNAQEVSSLICGGGNPSEITLGEIATNGGEIQSAFNTLIQCWQEHLSENGNVPWNLTLPVVECPGNNVTTCQEVVGAVNLNIVWITGAGEDPQYTQAPTQMGAWSSDDPNGANRWASFVSEEGFNLRNVDDSPAPYAKKSIYFLPDCEDHELTGTTGGENFGVLARIPVLVR